MEFETSADTKRFFDWQRQSVFGQSSTSNPKRGYVAPRLEGVWAIAPFFHNGSVPSLEGVLNSSKRPKFWKRAQDKDNYDIVNASVKFEELEHGQSGEFRPFMKRYILDTTLPGYSKGGHLYGDKLSDDERSAVIEYLKSL